MKGRRALLVTLGITAGLLALVAGLRGPYARFLAEHWRNRLDNVPDDRVAVLLESVAQLGEPGIPVLVEALDSERQSVATSGKRVLLEEMRHWETLRARDYSPKLAILAKALADRVDEFHPAARADAAELAAQILRLWALDEEVVDPSEVIACCAKVLRATSRQRLLSAAEHLSERSGQSESPGEQSPERGADLRLGLRRPGDLSPEGDAPLQGLAALPGGGLPIETHQVPRLLPDHSDAPKLAGTDLSEPRRLNGRGAPAPLQHPLRPLSQPDDPTAIPEPADSPSNQTGSTDLPLLRPLGFFEGVRGAAGEWPGGRSASGQLAGLDTVALMQCLQSPNDQTVARARAELVRRGFTEPHLALARQMFDPDPKVRMRLAGALLDVPGVDAVPWLLQLSRDEHADVRLSAIALLASTGDPAILALVEMIAREDPDSRVQRQAERIARGRRTVTR